jgi:hypothetical protein
MEPSISQLEGNFHSRFWGCPDKKLYGFIPAAPLEPLPQFLNQLCDFTNIPKPSAGRAAKN